MTLTEGAWAGQDAVLIGGGPSLKTFDWSLVRDRPRVIVVNRAYRDCQSAAIFFTEDIQFIEKFSREADWASFQGLKVFHALDPIYAARALELDPTIHVIHKTRPDKFWAKSFAEGLSCSSNSMIGALNIADLLGADPIYLLGVDCKVQQNGNWLSNFHDDYPETWRVNKHQLESFRSDFEHWAALHLRHRRIVNANPDSAVECWAKMRPEEALA